MDKRGFGMAELLVALFFIALFSAIALPKVWRLGASMRVDGEAARLASELMHHREEVMTITPMHRDFWNVTTEVEPRFLLTSRGYRIRVGGKLMPMHELPPGMKLIYNNDVRFNPTGNANSLTIELQEGDEIRYVIIDRVGRVRVSLSPPAN